MREAVLDTGFSGYLMFPPADVSLLGLPFQQRQAYIVGDNRRVQFDVHLATVIWDGQEREVAVIASDGGSLVGMRMFKGSSVFLDVRDGGEVRIEGRA